METRPPTVPTCFVTAVKSIVCHISSGPFPNSERIRMDIRRYQGSPKRADLPNNRLQPNFVTSGYPWLKPKGKARIRHDSARRVCLENAQLLTLLPAFGIDSDSFVSLSHYC